MTFPTPESLCVVVNGSGVGLSGEDFRNSEKPCQSLAFSLCMRRCCIGVPGPVVGLAMQICRIGFQKCPVMHVGQGLLPAVFVQRQPFLLGVEERLEDGKDVLRLRGLVRSGGVFRQFSQLELLHVRGLAGRLARQGLGEFSLPVFDLGRAVGLVVDLRVVVILGFVIRGQFQRNVRDQRRVIAGGQT